MKLRSKRCRICSTEFKPFSNMAIVCSVPCSLAWARKLADKKAAQDARTARVAAREARERVKTRGEHLREAQAAFNKFVRLRDADEPCISCARPATWQGQWDAGHYRSVGSNPATRFDLSNVAKQCLPCNRHQSGALIQFRVNLVKRIGLAEVERLEGPQEPKKYTVAEIQEIKAFYRAEVRRLTKEM